MIDVHSASQPQRLLSAPAASPPARVSDGGRTRAWQYVIGDYIALTKPRVISLLLLTTAAAMFITPAGAPAWYLVLWTMIGGYLMAGGANAVNMAYDSDIDRVMGRTSLRPTSQGRISARRAYVFGFALASLSLVVFVLFVNVLTAALALAGFVYYTVIYTAWLKRRTWHNIVIGGGAGAIPALVGWAAASSQITWPSLLLFAIVFYWTPPHFWALALMKRQDYARARVPMLPVIAGEAETARQIGSYSILLVILSLAPSAFGLMGWLYLIGALALGGVLLARAWRLWLQFRATSSEPVSARPTAARLYKYSLFYLASLFVCMVVDRATAWL
ncbi:MAG: heme o synthase [Anaerolineae bacterium]|nr:heme o synthase [Thermoflexales bacterium]MDW8407861.1 heme o synthase [Anaerolineae bacterium]